MPYTLGEAAKAIGRSKPTLLEAIKKGRISAAKDALGRYQIDPAELYRVYKPIGKTKPETEQDLTALMEQKEGENKALREKLQSLSELKERIERECEDLREDRNHWRLQARALPPPKPEIADTKPAQVAAGHEQKAIKKGFFRRFFG